MAEPVSIPADIFGSADPDPAAPRDWQYGVDDPPAPGSPATPAPTVDPSTVDALQQKIATLEAAVADADERIGQANAARDNALNGRQLAQALIDAQTEQRRLYEQEQAQRAAMQAPEWDEDTKARVLTDPDVLRQKALELVAFGHRAAVAQMGPRVRQGEIMYALGQPMVDLLADVALQKAQGIAANADGVDPEEFGNEELLKRTYALLQESASRSADPHVTYSQMTLNPTAIATAARIARTQMTGGGPVRNARQPARTVGQGDPPDTRQPLTRPPIVAQMEKTFGRRFSDAELRAAAEKGRRLDEII